MSELNDHQDPRVAKILEKGLFLFAGNQDAFQKWLEKPDPQLSGVSPSQLIKEGKPEVVARLIDAALEGIPD